MNCNSFAETPEGAQQDRRYRGLPCCAFHEKAVNPQLKFISHFIFRWCLGSVTCEGSILLPSALRFRVT